MEMAEKFLTKQTVMTLFGMENEKDLDDLVNAKKIPVIRIKNRKKVFYGPDLEKWLLKNRSNIGVSDAE